MTANEALMDLWETLLDDKTQLEKYITHPERLLIDDLSRTQRHYPRTANPYKLFDVDVTPLNTELKVERDLKSGSLLNFYEVEASDVGKTAKTSTSMKRAPGPPTDGVKGSSTSFPFWPGGMDEPALDNLLNISNVNEFDFDIDLENIPPGFECGMNFDIQLSKDNVTTKATIEKSFNGREKQPVNEINIVKLLMDIGGSDDDELFSAVEIQKPKMNQPAINSSVLNEALEVNSGAEIDDVAPKISPVHDVLNISQEIDPNDLILDKTEWAEVINVKHPVVDFHKKVPNMAHTWPFELDTFQKQAILHLEKQESVFVAAHTSAGKTVVAEYAVALSMKHLTKTIYTSPIKALSNQKFRDFKRTFKDVGLITGDVQLNVDSSCLIMTTEILRSMLYNGSDTIRDLEWVIFDEVHYINDSERGVVWEEVLILLPKHVNIVLLSATVPNALEFADWIGRTKRQKIYVISTPKRPVPLEHYLFTGTNVKAQNELYLIIGPQSKFSVVGYNAAKEAHAGKKDANTTKRSGSTAYQRHLNPQQERNIWMSILNLLKKKDQLPVVAFVFSRKLCDQNAQLLTSVDLTTATEKNRIHEFVQKCMQRLKGSDKSIPQVKGMRELLMRGLGIHHSGILPILKEVVEMLFQDGLVKLLFATETFAMGVNMPARTVIFDSIVKYDGTQRRNLRSEEYIQMAGRAGRRGLDTSGTVIILCKAQFPERADLEIMIQGKPTILESRFRLTYAMILNLLRVEKLRVEEMMKRSFSEINMQRNACHFERRLRQLQQKASSMKNVDCSLCRTSLGDYYDVALKYVKQHRELQKLVVSHTQGGKALVPGRVVVISIGNLASLGIVLRLGKSTNIRNPVFDVLIATDDVHITELETKAKSSSTLSNIDLQWVHMLNAHKISLHVPEGTYKYDIHKCTIDNIIRLTPDVVRIDGDKIIKDWEKRQIPRFKDDPPSQSFITATQELMLKLENSDQIPLELDPVKDLHIKDVDICDKVDRLRIILHQLESFFCTTCTAFEEHFKTVYRNNQLNEELQDVEHQLSDNSLVLLPEYKARVEVLKTLRYIDNSEIVQLKGRVACEISSHELVTTELIFDNVLSNFQPEEIAALLSCMVCQEKRQKDSEEVRLSEQLTWGKQQILMAVKRIGDLQQQYQIPEENFEDQFRFELVEVVYEWAKGMPFAEIMNLTDVQEGIIVRCIQRLDEILRDVKDAARIVGDPILYKKMEAASQAIKRDIVFAASLYTQ